MVFQGAGRPLVESEVSAPEPAPGELLLEVSACGVCRTDLHIVDGELDRPKLPLVLGHQVVARVLAGGERFETGDRVGVPWLGWVDGDCRYCRAGRENLCDHAVFTGYTRDGGYAERLVADERFCFPIPEGFPDLQAAPLLCAGLIGYRSLTLAGDAERLGIYGFGAAAHIICQVARHQGRRVFAFTRPGDAAAQEFALSLGAEWAGGSDERPPEELDGALIFAPVGGLVPAALGALAKGGTVVCGGIHMSDIPAFPYELLWGERVVRSVANLTRADGEEFLALATRIPVRTEVETHPLERANEALARLRGGELRGAAVVVPAGCALGGVGSPTAARASDSVAKGGPPGQLAVPQLHGLPHRLLDRDAAEHAGHAEVRHAAVAGSANLEQLPAHVLESARHRLPPGADAVVAVEGRSFRLGDHRRELHVLCGHRDEGVEIARVDRAERGIRNRLKLGARLRHRRPSIAQAPTRPSRGALADLPLRVSRERNWESASATTCQTLGCTAMPQWLVGTSTSLSAAGSRHACQSTTPSLFEYTETKPTPAGSEPACRSQKSVQQAPSRQLDLNSPGAPSDPRPATARTCARTSGCTASGSTWGEPSAMRPETSSGRREASTLPRPPPRL